MKVFKSRRRRKRKTHQLIISLLMNIWQRG